MYFTSYSCTFTRIVKNGNSFTYTFGVEHFTDIVFAVRYRSEQFVHLFDLESMSEVTLHFKTSMEPFVELSKYFTICMKRYPGSL